MARPRRWTKVSEMQKAIDNYLDSCKIEYLRDENGEIMQNCKGEPIILSNKRATVAGLALALGFTTRKSLIDYTMRTDEEDKPFVNAITRAKLTIEDATAQAAFERDSARGACFLLQNGFGYREEKGVDVSGEMTNRVINVTITDDDA